MNAEKKLDVRWRQRATPFEVAMWEALCNGVSVETRKGREAAEAVRLAYEANKPNKC
jgi:hypothetical protein